MKQNDLGRKFSRPFFAAKVAAFALLVLAYASTGVLLARSDWAAVQYIYRDRVSFAQRLDPDQALYSKTRGDLLLKLTDHPKPALAAAQYRRALQADPCSLVVWRDLAYARLRQGRIDQAFKALQAAEYLAPKDHSVQMELAALLLTQGRPEQAAPHHRNAIALRPSLAPGIWPRYREFGWAPTAVAAQVLPDNEQILNLFWTDCLGWLDPQRAGALWDEIRRARGDVFDAESYAKYFDFLIANKKEAQAKDLWNQILPRFYAARAGKEAPPGGLFWNGDFRFRSVFNGGLDWRFAQNLPQGVAARVSPWRGTGQNNSLWIHFAGDANVSFSQVRHLLSLEPGKTYRLRYRAGAANITSHSGPYVSVSVLSNPPRVTNGRMLKESGDWQLEQIFFVPENTEWAEIIICRDEGSGFGNRIRGDAWFDDFQLEVVEPVKENP